MILAGKGGFPGGFEGTFSLGIPAFPGKERGSIRHLALSPRPLLLKVQRGCMTCGIAQIIWLNAD
eukprot:1547319-Pyramimonas_sp.AAC.1